MRRAAVIAAGVLVLVAAVGVLLLSNLGMTERAVATEPSAVWSEVAWPFPMDQWGKGKAFTCKAADCGAEVTVYVRAKIGFCNCSTGVADDEELDRISDFDLFGNNLTAIAPGRPITVAWMKGRSRAFLMGALPFGQSALSIGFNDRCDAIIATAVIPHRRPTVVEPAVLEFLNSRTVLRWAEVTLGL
jgi:hypothetical protein